MNNSIYQFLKDRDAKPGDFIIADKGVGIVAGISDEEFSLILFNSVYLILKNSITCGYDWMEQVIGTPQALMRPIENLFYKDTWKFLTNIDHRFERIFPLIKPKRTVTIEVEEGAKVIINGKEYEY